MYLAKIGKLMDVFKLSNLKKLLIFNLSILITMMFLNNGQAAERTWVTGYYPLPVGPGFVTETCYDECNTSRCVDDSTSKSVFAAHLVLVITLLSKRNVQRVQFVRMVSALILRKGHGSLDIIRCRLALVL